MLLSLIKDIQITISILFSNSSESTEKYIALGRSKCSAIANVTDHTYCRQTLCLSLPYTLPNDVIIGDTIISMEQEHHASGPKWLFLTREQQEQVELLKIRPK